MSQGARSVTAERLSAIPLGEPAGSGASKGALAGLSLTMLMPSLATGIVNSALPALAMTFAASFQAAQWILLAYLLTMTATIVVAGQVGDRIGRRRFLLIGVALFAISSLLCAMAPSLALLVAARAIQGLGAAIMTALAITLVGDVVPGAKMGRAMGLLGATSAIGTALGPSLGGILLACAGWQAIFLINVPLGVLAFALVRRALPAGDRRSTVPGRPGFDSAGAALLALTLGAYALAMTDSQGLFRPFGAAMLLVALGAGACFVRVEARAASPLIRLALFRDRMLRDGLATNALVSTVVMTTLVVGPFYLSGALGLDAAMAGIALTAGPLVSALVGVPAGRLVDRFGAEGIAIAGLLAMTCGSFALCAIPHDLGVAGYLLPIAILTGGYAMFQAANGTAIMANTSIAQRGIVSGMLALSRNLGLMTGASAMGAVFAFGMAHDVSTATPAAIAVGMRTSFAVAGGLVGLALAMTIGRRRDAVRRKAC